MANDKDGMSFKIIQCHNKDKHYFLLPRLLMLDTTITYVR
jgi:hypothetical protein